ncbi:MAG: hypothetical protein AAGI52_06180 [Bacteroidota bacterium]
MGQQQLLLLVLSIVIVGLAVFAGILIYGESSRHDRADDVLNQSVRLAQEAIQWKGRAAVYGGGGGANATFDPLATGGFTEMGISGETLTTDHAIRTAAGQSVEIIGVSKAYPDIGSYVRVQNGQIDSTAVRYDGSITL